MMDRSQQREFYQGFVQNLWSWYAVVVERANAVADQNCQVLPALIRL